MKPVVFVFARAPRLGVVKRRLARGIGDRAALRFHRAMLVRLLRALRRVPRFHVVLAVTPDKARVPLPVRVPRVPQGPGGLGARMDRACRRLPHGPVMIVGCDIPALSVDDVAQGFRSLGRAEAAFGPAEDGGYWLVALSPRRPARPFAHVRWSSEHALADTLANFTGRRVALLRTLRDVDTKADLPGFAA